MPSLTIWKRHVMNQLNKFLILNIMFVTVGRATSSTLEVRRQLWCNSWIMWISPFDVSDGNSRFKWIKCRSIISQRQYSTNRAESLLKQSFLKRRRIFYQGIATNKVSLVCSVRKKRCQVINSSEDADTDRAKAAVKASCYYTTTLVGEDTVHIFRNKGWTHWFYTCR